MEELQRLWPIIVEMAKKMEKGDVEIFFRMIIKEFPQLADQMVQVVMELDIGPMMSHLAYDAPSLSIKSAESLINELDPGLETGYYSRFISLAKSPAVRAVAMAQFLRRLRDIDDSQKLSDEIEKMAIDINTKIASAGQSANSI